MNLAEVLLQFCRKKQVIESDCIGIKEILLLGLCITFLFSLTLKNILTFILTSREIGMAELTFVF